MRHPGGFCTRVIVVAAGNADVCLAQRHDNDDDDDIGILLQQI